MLIQKKKCVGKSYFWVRADTAAAELWTLQRFFCRNSVCGMKIGSENDDLWKEQIGGK